MTIGFQNIVFLRTVIMGRLKFFILTQCKRRGKIFSLQFSKMKFLILYYYLTKFIVTDFELKFQENLKRSDNFLSYTKYIIKSFAGGYFSMNVVKPRHISVLFLKTDLSP